MKIDISFQNPSWFGFKYITQWVYMYKRYTVCYGFILRIFGIYINVRENDSTHKIMEKVKEERIKRQLNNKNK